MFNVLGLVGSFVLKWYAFKYTIKSHYVWIVVASFIFALIMILPIENNDTIGSSYTPEYSYDDDFFSYTSLSWPSHLHCNFITKIVISLYPLYIAIIIALIGLSLGWFHWYGEF